MTTPQADRAQRLAVAAGALILGLVIINGRSIAADEAFSWGIGAQQDFSDFWDGLRFASGNMGAYLLTLRAMLLFDDSVVWMRLPSLLFFVGTVIMLGRIGTRWFGSRAGLYTSVLAATSVPLLYYGIEMRGYALVGLAATLMWSQLDYAISTDEKRHWIGLALACGLGVSAHVLTVLMLPTIAAAALILGRNGIVGTVLRLAPIAAAVLPTAALLAVGDGSNTQWIPGLSVTSIAQAGRFLLGDHAQFTSEGSGFVIAAAFALLYLLALARVLRRRADFSKHDVMAWAWLLTMPVALVTLSLLQPYLWHRYLMASLPGGLLVVGRYLSTVPRRQIAVGVLAALALLGVVRTVALRPHSSDSYEQVAAAIAAEAMPDDAFVVTTPWARAGLDYYWRAEAPVLALPAFGPDFDMAREVERLDRGPRGDDTSWIPEGTRVWVLDRSDSSQRRVEMTRTDADFDFTEIEGRLPDGYVVQQEFDVQRFRVRLYAAG